MKSDAPQPSELLLAAETALFPSLPAETLGAALDPIRAKTRLDAWAFSADYAIPLLERQLQVRSLEGFGLAGHTAAAIAAGAVLHYVRTTQKNEAARTSTPCASTSAPSIWNSTR